MVDAAFLEKVHQLDDAEKLDMIHALWNAIDHEARSADSSTIALVESRAAAADAHPEDEISSEEFWATIRRRYP